MSVIEIKDKPLFRTILSCMLVTILFLLLYFVARSIFIVDGHIQDNDLRIMNVSGDAAWTVSKIIEIVAVLALLDISDRLAHIKDILEKPKKVKP